MSNRKQPKGEEATRDDEGATEAYRDLTRSVERMHRRYLDVLKAELASEGIEDLTAVQALLLSKIEEEDTGLRELMQRAYYLSSSVSYNLKKLSEAGYLTQERAVHDRRAVRFRLTDKGKHLSRTIRKIESRHGAMLGDEDAIEAMRNAVATLRRVEQAWADILYSTRPFLG